MSKKPAAKPTRSDDGWQGYVNFSPTVQQREEIISFMGNGSFDVADYLLQLSESGYSCTIQHDEKNNCHRLSVTGKTQPCPNIGWTLSIRSSSPQRCVGIAAYYIYVLSESGDWLVDKVGKEVW